MTLQIYAHIAYTLLLLGGGGYLGYKYGKKAQDEYGKMANKVAEVKTAVKQ